MVCTNKELTAAIDCLKSYLFSNGLRVFEVALIIPIPNSRGQRVRRLPGMREVLVSNPLGGNILCSPSPSEEIINLSPNTPIPITRALICEELKDPGIQPKVVQL